MTEANLIRATNIAKRIGCCRSHVYKLIHKENFPKPLVLSKRLRAWLVTEVDAWLDTRNGPSTRRHSGGMMIKRASCQQR
ncbi:MAG: AlpA family phage regulatory protein [Gammaproteobacteria bacterium]|nr:AlpA family phage regulatory protein [Gammaproteobacteria bacterium]MDE0514680.1 AlpA family phage regulatory protein [Gammaproteobacteria bacterium]